jgi:Txe/YoeB family toxin of Txe-Axe toxin-antitoxin module
VFSGHPSLSVFARDRTHRLVYCVDGDDLVIIACRYHYDE